MVAISARQLKRLEAAENCCRALRVNIADPVYNLEGKAESQQRYMDWLIYWLELGGRDKYELPSPVPARWKRNRERSMGK